MIKKIILIWGDPYYRKHGLFIASTWVLLLSGCAFPNLAQVLPEEGSEELLIEQAEEEDRSNLGAVPESSVTLPDLSSLITQDEELLTVSPREPIALTNWNETLLPARLSSAYSNRIRLLPRPGKVYQFELDPFESAESILTLESADVEQLQVELVPLDPASGSPVEFDSNRLFQVRKDNLLGFAGLSQRVSWRLELQTSVLMDEPVSLRVQPLDAFAALRVVEREQVLAEDDLLRFRIDVTEPTRLFIVLQPDNALDGILELYAQEGYINTFDAGEQGEAESTVYDALQPGEYTLVVFGFESTTGFFNLEVIGFPLADLE
ncbi:MAG: hypothetical protein AAF633_13455 [Chloroflexota bacterium]